MIQFCQILHKQNVRLEVLTCIRRIYSLQFTICDSLFFNRSVHAFLPSKLLIPNVTLKQPTHLKATELHSGFCKKREKSTGLLNYRGGFVHDRLYSDVLARDADPAVFNSNRGDGLVLKFPLGHRRRLEKVPRGLPSDVSRDKQPWTMPLPGGSWIDAEHSHTRKDLG